jgi:hypothetical protein
MCVTSLAAAWLLVGSAQAETTPKPLSEADTAEIKAIAETYVQPTLTTVNSVVLEATSNPKHACELARDGEKRLDEVKDRIAGVHVRLVAEGKTTEAADTLADHVVDSRENLAKMEKRVCDGSLALAAGDPEVVKLQTFLSASVTDIRVVLAAKERGDHPATCKALGDVVRDISGAVDVMHVLRGRIPNGTAEAAEADKQLVQVGPAVEMWKKALADCLAENDD